MVNTQKLQTITWLRISCPFEVDWLSSAMEAVDAEVDCWLGSPFPELVFEKEVMCSYDLGKTKNKPGWGCRSLNWLFEKEAKCP